VRTASAFQWNGRTEGETYRPMTVERDDAFEVVVTDLALEPAAVRACA
jgi:hypothetical protein